MILTTFLSYVLSVAPTASSTRSWAGTGMAVQWAAMGIAAVHVTYYGRKGYFVESHRPDRLLVYQVEAVLGAIVVVMAIDIPMFRGRARRGPSAGGRSRRARSTFILLA